MALAPLFTLGPGSWAFPCPRTLVSISRVPCVQQSLGHNMLSLQKNSAVLRPGTPGDDILVAVLCGLLHSFTVLG